MSQINIKSPLSIARISASESVPRRGYTVNGWCESYGPGRSTVFKLIKSGKLKTVNIGGRTIITAESAEALLLPEEND